MNHIVLTCVLAAAACTTTYDYDPTSVGSADGSARAPRATSSSQFVRGVYADLLARGPRLVAFSHVSNAVGTVNDALDLARRARAAGATVLIDAAQSAPHRPLDVQALGCDFLAFSGHKTLAPMGSGVLYGRLELLEAMPPFMAGGGIRPGLTYGQTDDFGFQPVEGKIHLHDLHATLLYLLGLNHERLTLRHAGRDFRLTDVYGNVIPQILA